MNPTPLHLLIVEDEAAHVEAIRRAFDQAATKADIQAVGTLREYRERVAARSPDLVLLDLNLPDGRATEVLTQPAANAPFPILVMTAFGNQQSAVEVMKAGALDYVVKSPEAFAAMPQTVARAQREWQLLQKQKQVEAALRRSESTYRGLFEHMNEGIAFCQMIFENGQAADFVYLEVNPRFTALIGLKDVVGKRVSEVVPGIRETDPEIIEAYGRVAATGKPERFEHHIRSLEMWVDLSVFSTDPGFFVAMFDVITERKRTEAFRDRLVAILESTSDFVGFSDPAGHILYLNRAGRNMIGFGPDEDLTQTSIAELLPDPDNHIVLTEGIPAAIRDGQWSGEIVLSSRSGKRIPVSQVILAHKSTDGKLEFLSTIIRDITQRKKAEEAMREQTQELQARNDELTRFSRLTSGRELRVIELKQQVNALSARLGQPQPYPLAFMDAAAAEIVRTTPQLAGTPLISETLKT